MTALSAALRSLAREEWSDGRNGLLALVASEPDNADAWAYLSGAHLALADVDGAQAASARALELAPDAFAPLMKAGELSFRLGDLQTAEDRFLAAMRAVEPGTAEADAAKHALVVVRARLRGSIAHGARLPTLEMPSVVRSPLRWLKGWRHPLEGTR
jgi:tetratricopeptide (TPR) repeat protein